MKYVTEECARPTKRCAPLRTKQFSPLRSKQFKEREYRLQGVYNDVHDQSGTERNEEMRRL